MRAPTISPDSLVYLLGLLCMYCLAVAAVHHICPETANCSLWVGVLAGVMVLSAVRRVRVPRIEVGSSQVAATRQVADLREVAKAARVDHSNVVALTKQGVFAAFYSPAELPREIWEQLVPADDPCLQLDYLRAVATSLPRTELHVAVVFRGGVAIGGACYQCIEVEPAALGTQADDWALPLRVVFGLLRRLNRGPARLLLCGDILHANRGGFHVSEALPATEAMDVLAELSEQLRLRVSKSDRGATYLTVLKDLPATMQTAVRPTHGFHALESVQPTMVLYLQPQWANFADYLAAMSAKYRKRARSVRKKGAKLERVELTVDELARDAESLQTLLDAVIARADFKLTVA
ncbi:MAG: hypothetical protein ACPG77_07280, partial [Nannocystaceae bacterium]